MIHRIRDRLTRVRTWFATLWPGNRRLAMYWAERYFTMARRLARYELALEEFQHQQDSYEVELASFHRRLDEHDEDLDQAEIAHWALTGRVEMLETLEDDRQEILHGIPIYPFQHGVDDVESANGAVLDQLEIEEERAAA